LPVAEAIELLGHRVSVDMSVGVASEALRDRHMNGLCGQNPLQRESAQKENWPRNQCRAPEIGADQNQCRAPEIGADQRSRNDGCKTC